MQGGFAHSPCFFFFFLSFFFRTHHVGLTLHTFTHVINISVDVNCLNWPITGYIRSWDTVLKTMLAGSTSLSLPSLGSSFIATFLEPLSVLSWSLELAWDQAPHWEKREKKIGVRKRSEPSGNLRSGEGGRAWWHAFNDRWSALQQISCHWNVNMLSSHHGCQREPAALLPLPSPPLNSLRSPIFFLLCVFTWRHGGHINILCPKTMKRRPCWCPKPVLWEMNSFLIQTLFFVPINLHRCWPREWKHSISPAFFLPFLHPSGPWSNRRV